MFLVLVARATTGAEGGGPIRVNLEAYLNAGTGAGTRGDPVCGPAQVSIPANPGFESLLLEASEDLADPLSWEPLLEVAGGAGARHWHDPASHHLGRRFFRLSQPNGRGALAVAENFRLIDQDGFARELYREGDAAAVVLVFGDNATLSAAWPRVSALHGKWASKKVRFWMVNSHDSRGAIREAARTAGMALPVLHDAAQGVARAYGCTTRLEVAAVDLRELFPFYRGSLEAPCDAVGGAAAGDPAGTYLDEALTERILGKPGTVLWARSGAEPARFRGTGTLSYAADIAPILKASCVRCHSPGNIGSWSMTNHAVVVAHAEQIRRDLLTGDMPPWHADPAGPALANDFSLRPEDTARLLAWLDAGAPMDGGGDPLAAEAPPGAEEWALGKPDRVIEIPEQLVPASGVVPYKYLLLENPVTQDTWLKSVVVKPGNASVVHHALLLALGQEELLELFGAITSGRVDLAKVGESLGLGGYFGAYVPGMDPSFFPKGTAKRLRPGDVLILQMHYTTSGKSARDKTAVGLYLAEGPPESPLATVAAYTTTFTIPANAREHAISADSAPLARASWLYELSPHMHYRGSRMRFEAVLPDGTVELLANVPAYQFDWQTLYRLQEPRLLPAGTRIRCSGAFDNSRWNPRNPNPAQSVKFGEQSWEEMFIGYLNVGEVHP